METGGMKKEYWEKRKNNFYYRYLELLLRIFASEAKSILDVGSNATPILEYCDWIPDRTSIDIRNPYRSETVKGIKINFFDFNPENKFDIVTCLQVLEHIPLAGDFSKKLFAVSKSVIISVPYKWGIDKRINHFHDVDEEVLFSWTRRKPDHSIIVPEKDNKKRLIAYYRDRKKIASEDFFGFFNENIEKLHK